MNDPMYSGGADAASAQTTTPTSDPTAETMFASVPGSGPTLPSAPVRGKYEYSTLDILVAWLCWAVGYLFCTVIPLTSHLWGGFLYMMVMFGGALWLLAVRHKTCIVRGVIQAAVSLLLSVSFLVTTNTAIMVCVFLFDCVSWFYMVFVLSGASEERFLGDRFVAEVCTSVFADPFRAPGNLFVALFGGGKSADGKELRSGRMGKILGLVLAGLGIAILPTLVIGLLLSYDQGFTALLDKIFDVAEIGKILRNLIFGILLGAMMFGALLRAMNAKGRGTDGKKVLLTAGDGTHILPIVLVCAALTPVLVLYIIFFVSQWNYYVSAFTGVRPEALTFADYARDGFFELCTVAGINAFLGLMAALFARRRPVCENAPARDRSHPALRVYLCLLAVSTLVLIATALSKMFLYVDTYGLTRKRVYATWFMILLAVAFLLVILRQLCRKINLVGSLVCAFLVFFLAISLVNVDSLIVSYNVNACLDGNVRTMQGEVLKDVGTSGVLPALDFMERSEGTTDPDMLRIRAYVDGYLKGEAKKLHDMRPGKKNIVALRAEKALQESDTYATN